MKIKKFYLWLFALVFGLCFFIFGAYQVHAQEFAEREIVLERFENFLYSPVISEETFNTVTLQADYAMEGLMVNFNPLNGGVWEPVEIHDDGFGVEALLFTSPTKTIQFRKRVEYDEKQVVLDADFFLALGSPSEEMDEDLYAGPQLLSAGINVISRKSWGADENLRYWTPEIEELFRLNSNEKDYADPCGDFNQKFRNEVEISRVIKRSPRGEQLVWPLAYPKKIQKIIIHHTDSELKDLTGDRRMDGRDYKAMIQAIYYYHAITRGWGDIGYNYIIDPLGNVYEGRYGGDKVIGAHAQCYNNGSMGISIIGNYERNEVPQPALQSVISLIALKSKIHGIDPKGESNFRGRVRPNILGHRDVGNTSCPGKKLYALLPKIRERASLAVRSGVFRESALTTTQNLDYNAELVGAVPAVSLEPNERKKITLKFKNTGRQAWDQNTWLHASLNNKDHARVVPIIEGKNFVAADMRQNRVSPGRTATFEVELEGGYQPINYTFELAPVANGRFRISRSAVFIPVSVKEPHFDYRIVRKDLPSGTVFQGQKIQGTVVLQNTGNTKWFNYGDNPIRMGTEVLRDRRSLLVKKHATRVAHLVESEVRPGQNGTFYFDLDVPANYEGRIRERFSPVIENIRWLDDRGMGFEVLVRRPRHAASITNKTKVPSMLPGEMKKIELTMENRGDLPWHQDNMKVSILARGLKSFKNSLVPLKEVKPKQSVDFSFWVQAPYEEGRYRIFLKPRFNRKSIRGGSVRYIIDVPKPKLRAQMVKQSSRAVNLNPGEEAEVEVKFKNIGNVIWRNKGMNVIHLAPTRPRDRLSKLYYEDSWENKYRAATLVEKVVKPGEIGTFRFKVKPNRKGVYSEYFQLVIEHVGWIDGSFVRWDFRVFGKSVDSSIDLEQDSRQNVITRAIPTFTTITEPTTTPVSEPEPKVYTSVSSSDDLFRVRISYSDDYSEITADKFFQVIGDGNKVLFEVGPDTPVSIRRMSNNIHIQVGERVKSSGTVRIIPMVGGIVEIKSMERRPTWNRNLNDNRFQGILEIRPVNGQTAFINELPMEDYLKGLAEVSNDAPYEKQKVIAILARTYARHYMDPDNRKFPGLPYDGSDDPAIFQRYLGYGYEIRSPNFVAAVGATKDKVVTYQGELIKTPYFNQSDGWTRSANEAWGWTNTPYLQAVQDIYCEATVRKGHGVGLSGCGAEGMANEGKTYEEIIKYYYQGVEIKDFDF